MRGVTNPNPLAGFVASRRHSPNFAPNPNPAIRFVTFCMTAAARVSCAAVRSSRAPTPARLVTFAVDERRQRRRRGTTAAAVHEAALWFLAHTRCSRVAVRSHTVTDMCPAPRGDGGNKGGHGRRRTLAPHFGHTASGERRCSVRASAAIVPLPLRCRLFCSRVTLRSRTVTRPSRLGPAAER